MDLVQPAKVSQILEENDTIRSHVADLATMESIKHINLAHTTSDYLGNLMKVSIRTENSPVLKTIIAELIFRSQRRDPNDPIIAGLIYAFEMKKYNMVEFILTQLSKTRIYNTILSLYRSTLNNTYLEFLKYLSKKYPQLIEKGDLLNSEADKLGLYVKADSPLIEYIIKETQVPTSLKRHLLEGLGYQNYWPELILRVYDPYYINKDNLIQNVKFGDKYPDLKLWKVFKIAATDTSQATLVVPKTIDEAITILRDIAATEYEPGTMEAKEAIDRLELASGVLKEECNRKSYSELINTANMLLVNASMIKVCSAITVFRDRFNLDRQCDDYEISDLKEVLEKLILILHKSQLCELVKLLG